MELTWLVLERKAIKMFYEFESYLKGFLMWLPAILVLFFAMGYVDNITIEKDYYDNYKDVLAEKEALEERLKFVEESKQINCSSSKGDFGDGLLVGILLTAIIVVITLWSNKKDEESNKDTKKKK